MNWDFKLEVCIDGWRNNERIRGKREGWMGGLFGVERERSYMIKSKYIA